MLKNLETAVNGSMLSEKKSIVLFRCTFEEKPRKLVKMLEEGLFLM